MRKVIFAFIGLTLLIVTLPSGTWGLAITKPISGTVFHPGDNVVVKAEASPGENLQGIFFFTDKVDESIFDLQPPYEFEFKIEPDFAGALTIVADGKLIDSKHVEARVQIIVALPVDVKLKSIEIDPNPVLLYKLPTGSDPNRIRIFETKKLGVGGIFTDGIEREITSSAVGTTYTSSDEKIVTVSPEGEVKAQGAGTATITVRNGGVKADVKVIVKAKTR